MVTRRGHRHSLWARPARFLSGRAALLHRRKGFRMRGTRYALLVAILAGSLVLTGSRAAEAAVAFGDSDDWSIDWGYAGVGGVACTGAVRWKTVDGANPSIIGTVKCRTTGAIAAFGGFDAGSTTSVRFTGDRVGIGGGAPGPGPACSFGTGALPLSGDPATATINVDGSMGCTITQVCQWVDHVRDSNIDDQYREKCRSISLGEPPTGEENAATCVQGDFLPPTSYDSDGEGTTGYPAFAPLSRARFAFTPGASYNASQGWNTYLVLSNGNITGGTPVNGNNSGWFTNGAGLADADGDGPLVYLPEATVVGIGVYATGAAWGNPAAALPQNNAAGRVGITDPSKCSFYWGTKVAVTTGDDFDEPLGSLPMGGGSDPTTEPPDPEDDTDDGCGFSFTDPSSWAGAGICELVNLIRSLISAVGDVVDAISGLPGAIVGLLGDALEALFIPEDAPSFGDIPSPVPTGWLPDFPDLGDGSCGTVTLPSVDLGNMLGNVGPAQLFDTCDDPWPFVRTITYNGTLALVLITLMFAAWRAVATALGINVDNGSAGDDE